MDDLWRKLTFGEPCASEMILVLGHKLQGALRVPGGGALLLCQSLPEALGHTGLPGACPPLPPIFVDGTDREDGRRHHQNPARRSLTFIDTLYDHRIGFVASAAVEPGELCRPATTPSLSGPCPELWKCVRRRTWSKPPERAPTKGLTRWAPLPSLRGIE